MKKAYFIFVVFILSIFAFQNVYSEGNRTLYKGVDPDVRRYVLWRVYTQSLDFNGEMYVTVDSVLKMDSVYKDFHIKEKFRLSGKKESISKLKPNTYYLVQTMAGCARLEKDYWLFFPEEGYILPDTPENRELLSKTWSETKVIYEPPRKKYPKIKGVYIDL